jgi:sirohydrochlorin cobaltochelatase
MDELLIVVGHGTGSAEGDAALHDLAAALAGRDIFADVRVALLRGEPGLAAVMAGLGDQGVCLLPFLMSGGVTFQNRLVTAMRGLSWAQTPQIYPPLGFNPGLAPLLANRAQATAHDWAWPLADNHVVLIGHGTLRDPASAQAARMHQRAMAALNIFADVEVAFLDQPPRLDHVLAHHQGPLIGIGLFAGEGRHGASEMVEAFAASSGLSVYCGAIGRDPGLAKLAVEHLKQAPWPVDFKTRA